MKSITLLKTLIKPAKKWDDLVLNQSRKVFDIVLCYHEIGYDVWEFTTRSKEFFSHIKLLHGLGEIVSLNDMLNQENTSRRPRVAITFDDGYASVFTYAYPILKSLGLTATVFLIGNAAVNPKQSHTAKLLDVSQIEKLFHSGWNFGFHTQNHSDLTQLDTPQLKAEIESGKKTLEQKLKISLDYFAYPFGRYNHHAVTAVRKAGFTAGFTCDGGTVKRPVNTYQIDRIVIGRRFTTADITNLFSPTSLSLNKTFTSACKVKNHIFERMSFV